VLIGDAAASRKGEEEGGREDATTEKALLSAVMGSTMM